MSTSMGKIPKIPRIPKKTNADPAVEKKEFSGEIEGGTLWQFLRVEESLIRNILLRMSPVDLINLEKTCVLMRDLIVQNKVWKKKLLSDFSHLLASNEVADKLELVVTEADEKHGGDVVKNENWSYKLKYVHCWNLQLNWDKGQFLQGEITDSVDDEWWTLSTDFSAIGAELFCHKTKTLVDLGFEYISSVIEVSSQSLLIYGSTSLKLVEKNSLKVLAECECGRAVLGPCIIGDKLVFYGGDEEAHVFNFQVDPPYIEQVKFDPVEQQLLAMPAYGEEGYEGYKLELSGQYCVDNLEFKIDLYKADFTNVAHEKKLYQKVWSLDISSQTSFPKVWFTAAMIDFPFMYVGKSNWMLEVWDVTKDELVKTIDPSELLNAKAQSNLIDRIQQNAVGKVCAWTRSGIFVINANLIKTETDSPLGYSLNQDVFGCHGTDHLKMEVGSTCIVAGLLGSLPQKFDFWPICPDNFKLKPAKPEVKKEALVKKAKKRVDQSCSSRYDGQVKKKIVGDESEDSDREDDYDYLHEDMTDFGNSADDDHEQFYDDDNDDLNDDYY